MVFVLLSKLFFLLCVILLASCVSASDPRKVSESVKVENNPHTGLKTYRTGLSSINNNILSGTYMLRSSTALDGSIDNSLNQLYFSVYSANWMFLDSAYSQGSSYPFTPIARQVVSCGKYGCTLKEEVAVNLSTEEIKEFATVGFVVQLTGKRGRRVVTIPATFFQGYLDGSSRA